MFFKCFLLLFCSVFIEAQYSYNSQQRCPWPHLNHGRVRVRQRTKMVKFICYPRYELVGNRYATCRDGHWDEPLPVCVKPGCPPFSVPNSVQIKAHHEAWITTFCMPGYKLAGSAAIYCNGISWNATVPRCISSDAPISLNCSFEESDLCGWMQDDQHDFDWIRLNLKTPSSFLSTGPSYDHTLGKGERGHYMYIESSSKAENNTARLLSPVYDGKLAIDGCFSFFYHMYGQGIGGLRVYQKPDSIDLNQILGLSNADKQKYIIFEQWGNLGDFWYSQTSQLKNINESFQIVLEGIRGTSFTSDIAVDDVAILQGINCTYFRNAGTTPVPPQKAESCAGRCLDPLPVPSGCECSASCMDTGRCCQDYLEICAFDGSIASDDYVSTSEDPPQTDKLISDNSTTTRPSNSTTTTPKAIPNVNPKPVPQTTQRTTKVTNKPTTRPSTKPPTTKPNSTITMKPTKITTKATTMRATTTTKLITEPTPTKQLTNTTANKYPTSIIIPTNITEMDKKKGQKEMEIQKPTSDKVTSDTQTGSSAWKTASITIVVLAVVAALTYLAVASRTNRGRVALARLRGRTLAASDPEVRYLNSNDDDL